MAVICQIVRQGSVQEIFVFTASVVVALSVRAIYTELHIAESQVTLPSYTAVKLANGVGGKQMSLTESSPFLHKNVGLKETDSEREGGGPM